MAHRSVADRLRGEAAVSVDWVFLGVCALAIVALAILIALDIILLYAFASWWGGMGAIAWAILQLTGGSASSGRTAK